MYYTEYISRVKTVVLFPIFFAPFLLVRNRVIFLSRVEVINIVQIGGLSFASIIQFIAAINADTTTNRIIFARWKVAKP